MLFCLLGPLEVSNANAPVRIGAGRQREVLIALLLHRNELVTTERLVDALWGERPPATAAKVVQNAVGQLRRTLDDRSGQRLQTSGHGYVLRVAPGELDIDGFEELVRRGARALADGRPAAAADQLRDALALWRGPPLTDVAYETFAQPEIARLEELRAVARERRIDAELALGAHLELVPELESLVGQYPLRERLRAQLMLALYRCGRQAEALSVFREGRRVSIDEIGAEPGPELRDLHEAILRQESSLELERLELPRELELRGAPSLVGRDRELRWLLEHWNRARDGQGAVVALTGEPGIGKTRLAAELAAEVQRTGGRVVYGMEAMAELVEPTGQTARPTLVVIDDVAAGGGAWPRGGAGPELVLVTADRPDRLTGLGVTASIALGRLEREAVTEIASAYASDGSVSVPGGELHEASGGVPRRVHEVASAWAAREAARRVVAFAPRAAADRDRLRLSEHGLAGRLLELQEAEERLDRFRDDGAHVLCPFKGLASFEFADAAYFCGRERLMAELVARAVGAPLLGVVGPSGSGKSSLVKAGLLPALASGVLPGSETWPRAIIRPGEHPMRELARLGDDPIGVLAIDQFEELFTACRDEPERLAFVAEIVDRANRDAGDGLVVVAVRADYYGRCAAYPSLSRLLGANHVLVGPMDASELRRAIERPAARAGLDVDRELVDAIVADVEGEPGALPLVSSALLELWQRRDGRRLRHETYETTGGVRGAVTRLAEAAFAALDLEQQRIARQVLVRLAADGPAGEVVRRRVALADLRAEAEGEVRTVVELLADRRLLTLTATSVEVAHEALLREWPRLREWLEADAHSRRVHRHLAQASSDWRERGRDPTDLYRGARLAVAQEWRTAHEDELDPTERAFLDASRVAAERQQRRLRLALAGVAALLAIATVAAVVAVHQRSAARHQTRTAVAQRVSLQALTAADLDRSLLLAREGVALADSPVTRGNLLHALTRSPAALGVIRGEGTAVRALDVDRQGRTLVMGDNQGNVELIDTATRRSIRRLKILGPITAVRLSPDGSLLAVTSLDYIHTGVLRLFDTRTFAEVQRSEDTVELPFVDVASPVFSPDSRVLAADVGEDTGVGSRHYLLRWDARTGRPLGPPHPLTSRAPKNPRGPDVPALGGFVDHGARLVTSSARDAATFILDAHSLRRTRRFPGGGTPIALSADGRVLALTGPRTHVRLLDLRTGRLRALGGPRDGAATVGRFTPDSRSFVTAGRDATLTVWDARTARPTQTIGPLPAPVRALAISTDGTTAYGADDNGAIIAWDLTGRRGLARPFRLPWRRPAAIVAPAQARGPLVIADAAAGLEILDSRALVPAGRVAFRGGAVAIAVAPDARTAAVGTANGSIGFADLRARRLLGKPELSHVYAVRDLAFSPDGRWLASSDGKVVFLWDAPRRRKIAAFQGAAGVVTSIGFSPDSRRLVVADARPDGSGALDVLAVPHLPLVRQVPILPARQTEFSPDGKIVFVADRTGRIWLLDSRTWKPLGAPLPAHAGRFALDPTDRLLATSSPAAAVQLWDVRSGHALGGPLPGTSRGPVYIAFVPEGRALVTLRPDGTGDFWDVRPRSWARRACAVAGRPLTPDEWHEALPELSYAPACATAG